MPIGGGILPASGSGQYNELVAVTRRAFIPKMIVQIYNSSPLAAALLSNAQSAGGGVSPITVPTQGAPFVTPSFTDYSGSFNAPTVQQGTYNAEFNLKMLVTPVPFLGMEGLAQQDAAIIPLIEARMNDATNGMMDSTGTALYNNYTNTQQFIGLPGAIDDGTNLATYGNINRSTYPFWQSKRYAAGSVNPTRANVMQYIGGVVKKCGEKPNCGVMGMGTWLQLSQDFLGLERYNVNPGGSYGGDGEGKAAASFEAISVAGIPIYADPYCPEGTMYLFNTNYMSLYVHDLASFQFTGFESMLPNYQIGFVGAVMLAAELVLTKPRSTAVVTGYNYVTI